MAKDGKDKQPKQAKGGKDANGAADAMSVANHPRAGAQIARAKGWAGLAGFLLVAYLSWRAGAPLPDTLTRAIAGGVFAYVAAWACAVVVWRHLVVAELRAVRRQRAAAARRRAAAAAAQRADAS